MSNQREVTTAWKQLIEQLRLSGITGTVCSIDFSPELCREIVEREPNPKAANQAAESAPLDHPTSMLPQDPRRLLLERIQNEMVAAAKRMAWPPATINHWVNRITEVIHFNGRIPEVISGIRDPDSGFKDLDNAMNRLTYIATAESLATAATHAKLAFNKLHLFRHHIQERVTEIILQLDAAKSAWVVFDEDSRRSAVKSARDIAADFLGLK